MSGQSEPRFPTISFSLVVRGTDVDPDAITAAFGTRPSRSQRRGGLISPRIVDRRFTMGMWQLKSGLDAEAPLEAHLAWLVEQVTCSAQQFVAVVGESVAEVICQISPNGPDADAAIEPRHSSWLAERKLPLRISFYNFTPAEAAADFAELLDALKPDRPEAGHQAEDTGGDALDKQAE